MRDKKGYATKTNIYKWQDNNIMNTEGNPVETANIQVN